MTGPAWPMFLAVAEKLSPGYELSETDVSDL